MTNAGEWTTEMKEDWRQRRDEYREWQSRIDESQEEAIRYGELRKSAKELSLHLPDGYSIEVDYDEMGHHRVSVIGPHGVMLDSHGA